MSKEVEWGGSSSKKKEVDRGEKGKAKVTNKHFKPLKIFNQIFHMIKYLPFLFNDFLPRVLLWGQIDPKGGFFAHFTFMGVLLPKSPQTKADLSASFKFSNELFRILSIAIDF